MESTETLDISFGGKIALFNESNLYFLGLDFLETDCYAGTLQKSEAKLTTLFLCSKGGPLKILPRSRFSIQMWAPEEDEVLFKHFFMANYGGVTSFNGC